MKNADSAKKGEAMKYATKIREMEAVRYDGGNVAEIEALVAGQLENFVYRMECGDLLLRDGMVHIGDWVGVECGLVKILSDEAFRRNYEGVRA
jgi:hypothetical protein